MCSLKRRIRPSGSATKIKFDKNFGSGPGQPGPVGCRDPGIRYRQPATSPRGKGFSVLRIFLTAAESPRAVRRPGNAES